MSAQERPKRSEKQSSSENDPFILSSCQEGVSCLLIRHRICEKVD